MRYDFDGDIKECAAHFAEMGKRRRLVQAQSKTKIDQRSAGAEASAYEYCANVLETSDLWDGKFITVDGDMEEARNAITHAIRRIKPLIEDLEAVTTQLEGKLKELGDG